jgi:hypothetical protein
MVGWMHSIPEIRKIMDSNTVDWRLRMVVTVGHLWDLRKRDIPFLVSFAKVRGLTHEMTMVCCVSDHFFSRWLASSTTCIYGHPFSTKEAIGSGYSRI